MSAFAVLVVMLLGVARASADPTYIRLRCQNGDLCVTKGIVLLLAAGDKSPAVRVVATNDVVELPSSLDAGTWNVELVADGAWMPPQHVVLSSNVAEVKVWRTAPLRGRFAATPATDLPKTFRLVFNSPPGARAGGLAAEASIECPVSADGTWTCAVPAIPLDVVVRPKGFVPRYLWSVTTGTNVGTLSLVGGASLVAWLDRDTMGALKGPARARLLRMAMPESSPAGQRLAQPVAEATFNTRGMVQLAPAGPGTYTLEIVAPDFAATRFHEIELFAGSESVLRQPIRLDEPLTIRLLVSPNRTADGKPWRVELRRADEFTGRLSRIVTGVTDQRGTFEVAEQSRGKYHVIVRDARENAYASREVRIDNEAEATQTIDLALANVRGIVRFADQALREAKLLFGGRSGTEKIASVADEDGRFEVTLPRRGRWTVDIESADVAAAAEVIVRDEPLTIELPDTEVSGWVVGADGGRAANAVVTAVTHFGVVMRKVDPSGTFRLRGVAPGRLTISASDAATQEKSALRELEVDTRVPVRNLQLQLEHLEVARGTVTSRGLPVAGARVIAYTADASSFARRVTAVSDVDGRFELRVSGGATALWLIVAAAGRVMQAYSTPLDSRPIRIDLAAAGGTLSFRIPEGARRAHLTYNNVTVPINDLLEWARAHNAPEPKDRLIQIPRVAPGAYRLCAELPSKGESCRAGTLAAGSTLELRLN